MYFGYRIGRTLSRLLWVGGLVLLLLFGLGLLAVPPAAAKIHFMEEAPGQMIYQSQQSLRDADGHTWQAIAFKRIDANDRPAAVYLRLVGFPGVVDLDHTQPLTLIPSLGDTLITPDVSSQIFADNPPGPNVGQYDLQSILPQLETAIPLTLSLTTIQGDPVEISVAPPVLEEWKIIFSCQALMCNSSK